MISEIRKTAFVGDYLPRKCGIATFTTDLRCAVAAEFPSLQCLVVPVNDVAGGYDYALRASPDIIRDFPDIVYTCGALLHGRELIIRYAMSDYATSFAAVSLDHLIEAINEGETGRT